MQQTEFNTKDSCKIASAIGYRVYRPCTAYTALYSCFSNCLQSVVPTGYRLHSLVHSTTGYRVYRPGTGYTALYSCFHNYRLHSLIQLLQQLVTECTDRVPATQQCKSYPAQPVTESSDPVHSTLLILGQVDS